VKKLIATIVLLLGAAVPAKAWLAQGGTVPPGFTNFLVWTDYGAHVNTASQLVWTDYGAHIE
jgi:hypothetical protein